MESISTNIERYLAFVNEEIKKFKSSTKLITNDHITPEAINRALGDYQITNATLIAEYQRSKTNEYIIKAQFEDWWDSKVSEARDRILSSIEGKKYPAYKEYELVAKKDNEREYREFQDKINVAENETSFLRRLVEAFKKQDNVLVNLSLNMRSELKALSLEDRVNSNPKLRKTRRIVSTEN